MKERKKEIKTNKERKYIKKEGKGRKKERPFNLLW